MNYKYIWAWEILKGTTSADIVRGIVSLAREENAPARAIMRLTCQTKSLCSKLRMKQKQ